MSLPAPQCQPSAKIPLPSLHAPASQKHGPQQPFIRWQCFAPLGRAQKTPSSPPTSPHSLPTPSEIAAAVRPQEMPHPALPRPQAPQSASYSSTPNAAQALHVAAFPSQAEPCRALSRHNNPPYKRACAKKPRAMAEAVLCASPIALASEAWPLFAADSAVSPRHDCQQRSNRALSEILSIILILMWLAGSDPYPYLIHQLSTISTSQNWKTQNCVQPQMSDFWSPSYFRQVPVSRHPCYAENQ